MSAGESTVEKEPALKILLDLYGRRPDLQRTYPEVRSGDYGRLVEWAAAVSAKRWEDSAHAVLETHRNWYLGHSLLVPKPGADPRVAFKTWNQPHETLEAAERRIHDGVPVEKLRARAEGYVDSLCGHFPWAAPRPGAVMLEIGSGVAYIMEAMHRRLHPSRIIGLDVAPAMVEKAKARLARDQVSLPAEFLLYDGITIPMEARTVDYVYSVACLQHIPKTFVYHLFSEILRILKPDGAAALHFLAFSALKLHRSKLDFAREIAQQLAGAEGHWHHFYSVDELSHVLTYGWGAEKVKLVEADGNLWASFRPRRL